MMFVEAAAKSGFWQLTNAMVKKLSSSELNLALHCSTFADVLFEATKSALKCSDKDACVVLEERCSGGLGDEGSHAGILMTAEVDAALCKDDWATAVDCVKAHERKAQIHQEVQTLIFDVVQRNMKKKKFQGSRTPFPPLTSSLEPAQILSMMPPGSNLKLDRFNGRWHAFYRTPQTKSLKTLSRSWGIRTHMECVREILMWSWTLAVGYGQPCP